MKTVKIAALGLVAVLAVGLVLLVVGVPAGFLVGALQSRIESETGYRLRIDGSTRIGLWPAPAISVREITLFDRNDVDRQGRFQADTLRISVSLSSLFSGSPRVTDVTVVRPVVRVPLVRDRVAARAGSGPVRTGGSGPAVNVDRINVEDGTVMFTSGRSRDDGRIDNINLAASLERNRLDVKGSARWNGQQLRFDAKGETSGPRLEGQTIPIEWVIEAPGLLREPASAVADLRYAGSLLTINGLRGTVGRNRFTGWMTMDMTSNKPLMKGDFDFQKLDLTTAQSDGRSGAIGPSQSNWNQPWSDRELDLDGLNFVDLELRFSAGELNLESFRFAPISVEATVNRGVLNANFTRTGLYGGQGRGTLVVDVSGQAPAHVLRVDLEGVNAFPLLSDVADFKVIDGRMQAKIDVRANGASARSLASTLGGTADLQVQDGELRGVNVAKMIRGLTTSTQSGWQENTAEKTDLSVASALFRIDRGEAKTDNLRLLGPLIRVTGGGTLDIVGKTLQFKVEPKLVATLQGQGGQEDALGFGVPVRVEGPWNEPKFYPDVAGILDNPDAAYSRLRQLGSGLFGGSPGGQSGNTVDRLFQGLGNILDRPGTTPGPTPGRTDQPPAERRDTQQSDRRDQPPAERKDTQQVDRKDTTESEPKNQPSQTTDRPGNQGTDQKDAPKTPTAQEVMKTLNDLFGTGNQGGQGGQGGQSPARDFLRDLFSR